MKKTYLRIQWYKMLEPKEPCSHELTQLFDLDRDGILDFKQYEKLLRTLGYRLGGGQLVR